MKRAIPNTSTRSKLMIDEFHMANDKQIIII